MGLVIFSNTVKTYIPPQKGKTQLKKILDVAYSVEPDRFESDHEALCSFLSSKQRRRCLLSVFTYIDSEQEATETARAYEFLSKNNMLVLSSLQSPGLSALSAAVVKSAEDVYVRAAAIYRLDSQRRAATAISGRGIYGVFAVPADLLTQVINKYVMIKKLL